MKKLNLRNQAWVFEYPKVAAQAAHVFGIFYSPKQGRAYAMVRAPEFDRNVLREKPCPHVGSSGAKCSRALSHKGRHHFVIETPKRARRGKR